MTILQQIVLGWFLLGIIGKVLYRLIFGQPSLDDAPERWRTQAQLGKELEEKYPQLIFILDLFLAIIYAGQISLIPVLKRVLIDVPIFLLKNLVIKIKNFFIGLRVGRQRKRLLRTYPLESAEEIEIRMTNIAIRWYRIYREN
jgi:hypothetical protein